MPDGEQKQSQQNYLLMKTGKFEDVVGATAVHEGGHAIDPENLKLKSTDQYREDKPNEFEQKELDQRTKQTE